MVDLTISEKLRRLDESEDRDERFVVFAVPSFSASKQRRLPCQLIVPHSVLTRFKS